MSAWASVELAEVCTLITDGTHHSPPNLAVGDYKYVTAKNIRPWGLDISNITYVDAATHQGIYARCPVEFGDVLYIKDGVTTGIAALNTLEEPFSMLSSVALLKTKRNVLEPRYLKHWLNSPSAYSSMTGEMTGTAIKRLILKQIRATAIHLAPLPEQKRIADKLDSVLARVDACRDRLDRLPALLKRFRQSILAAATSGQLTEDWRNDRNPTPRKTLKCHEERKSFLGKKAKHPIGLSEFPEFLLPLTWDWVSFDEICLKITDGTHHSPSSHSDGEFMYVTSKNVREGRLDLENMTYVDAATHSEIYSRCDVVCGDVLYVKDGANTGLACVNSIEEQISLLSSVGVLRPSSEVSAKYMEHYLNSPTGRSLMLGKMGGTAIKRLTLSKISASPISLPTIPEQAEIVSRIQILFAFADRLEARLATARQQVGQLTPSLLAKAFRGELVAQDPADEPAAELLKRLAAQRAAAPKTKHGRAKG